MRDDDGSAALEFITVGVILLVPLVYLVLALGAIQEQSLGVEAAARHTARTIALADDARIAAERGDDVLAGVVDEYGIDPDSVEVQVTCEPAADVCPHAGAVLTVTVTARVALPLVPAVLGLDRAAGVDVRGTAVQKVPMLWGAG